MVTQWVDIEQAFGNNVAAKSFEGKKKKRGLRFNNVPDFFPGLLNVTLKTAVFYDDVLVYGYCSSRSNQVVPSVSHHHYHQVYLSF